MLTSITITKNQPMRLYQKLWYKLFRPKPYAEVVCDKDFTLLRIILKQKGEKIPWKKILRLIPEGTDQVLCRPDLQLPIQYGIRRFSSELLMHRLCENGVIEALKEANISPDKINISLYDPNGDHSEMAQLLIQFCSQLRIVTNNLEFYNEEANRLMDTYGASILVGAQLDWISPCNILVAPEKIEKRLHLTSSTIVFTGERPAVPIKGTTYYSYKVCMPDQYARFLPNELENEYFLSALYAQENIREIGSLVPDYFVSDIQTKSMNDVVLQLQSIVNNKLDMIGHV